MTLEIRELHIKVNINDTSSGDGAASPPQVPGVEKARGEEADRLIAQCVDEVMQVLRNRKER